VVGTDGEGEMERSERLAQPAASAAAPGWEAFDRWSSNLFLLLALLGLLGALVALAWPPGDSPALVLSTLLSSLATIAGAYALMVGLRDARSWARPASAAVLLAIVAAGVLQVILDLTASRITIPLGALLAIVVLGKRPSDRPPTASRDRRIGGAAGIAAFLILLPTSVSAVVARPPAFLVAEPEDLVLRISTNCDDPARITPGEDRPVVFLTWEWQGRDVLPGTKDAFLLEWHEDAPLRAVEDAILATDGVTETVDGEAAAELLPAGSFGGVLLRGIEPGSRAASEGSMQVPFAWTGSGEDRALDFVVTWAHGRHWTTPSSTSCEWPAGEGANP
jgi:hypothetical protein